MPTLAEERISLEKATSIVLNLEREFSADVDRIRFTLAEDWTGDPGVFLRVVLKDESGKTPNLAHVMKRLRERIREEFRAAELEAFPYVNVRTATEQSALRDPLWD
jgi:hypothetical protein